MSKFCRDAVGLLISTACAFLLPANFARAADCKPLRLINSIKMTTNADRNRFYVPVAINGTSKRLVLDTGGGLTQLFRSVTDELKLQAFYSNLITRDMYGDESNKAVRLATFDLGGQRAENVKIQIAALPDFGKDDESAGLLSTDFFLQYDVDLDFGAERMNYFSQDHCEGKVVYWPERPLAILPVDLKNGHISLDVTLDGKIFDALVDTGAPVTAVGVDEVADVFNLQRGSTDLPVVKQDKDNPNLKFYSHNFERLSFGDITVLHPQIELETSKPHSMLDGPVPAKITKGRVIIGMNVLRQLHIYIAYREKKLYITPAGSGESALLKPAAPP